MSGKEQRLPDYLGHMIEAIDRIESYIGDMDKPHSVRTSLSWMQ
jgi:hypothetical protein